MPYSDNLPDDWGRQRQTCGICGAEGHASEPCEHKVCDVCGDALPPEKFVDEDGLGVTCAVCRSVIDGAVVVHVDTDEEDP